MGYQRINQFANVTEIYSYEKEIKQKAGSPTKAYALTTGRRKKTKRLLETKRNRQRDFRQRQKELGRYERSKGSIKRSRDNFFRLCHHNVYLAKSVHFLTITFAYDVPFKTASRHVARFMEKISNLAYEVSVSYISVPELTEEGRYHFHLLVFNLPTFLSGEPRWYKTRKGDVWYTTERETRNLQRLFERGYIDIVPARHTSTGIAGYMAKYMGKALADSRYESTRGYNCSRGVEKIYSAGGNTLSKHNDLLIPTDDLVSIDKSEYSVPYLGKCEYTKIVRIKN